MLVELRVKNFGIIEDVVWRLHGGLNVVTGETGAGKSLLIDAIRFLLSGRADEEAVRHGADEALVEGVFRLSKDGGTAGLRETLTQRGVASDEDTLAVECHLRRHGSSVARVNTHAVPKALLNAIGRSLVDIHGESEHSSLLDSGAHLDILDSYAHCLVLRNEMAQRFSELRKTEQELSDLDKNQEERLRREDFLKFQIDEIDRAKLSESEEDELQQERVVLASAEKLRELSGEVYDALDGEETAGESGAALHWLNQAAQAMKRLVALDPSMAEQLKAMDDAVCSLTEMARDVHAYNDRVRSDPGRVEEIESRLEQVRSLKRKYGKTVGDVLAYCIQAQRELEGISDFAAKREKLDRLRTDLKQECGRVAYRLSRQRSAAANRLEADVMRELSDLNMPQVVFHIPVRQERAKDGVVFPNGEVYAMDERGADLVEFMASTNPGEPIKPLAKIASTGEMSRFALALKGALAGSDHTPVLIFDEIDLGVGGRSAEVVGKKLWALGRNHQVICVTHLPQIAAFADAHFNVRKVTSGDRTLSTLESLQDKSLVSELAAMLSGPNFTETSLRNARELLRKADGWKVSHSK